MNKSLLLIGALLSASVSNAEIIRPTYTFAENFQSVAAAGTTLPDGWTTDGVGMVVNPSFQDYFGTDGATPFYRVWNIEGWSAAWSCSTYEYASQADEWLITPPIHITSDAEVLELTAVSNGAYATNRYRVLISENGQDRDSFRPNPLVNTTLTGWETEVRTKSSYAVINGYAGKDICLAFVNKSEDAGMLGFTDIAIAPYTIDVTDLTPAVLPTGSKVAISLSANVRTPMDVTGVTAKLTTSTGHSQTLELNSAINIYGQRISVVFDEIILPEGGFDYTITITPYMDNATPTEVTGEIGTPSTSYPAAAIIEEFTGTWCSNCPRGIAFMEYYSDHYTGTDGRIKAIGIALHSTNDPMLMKDPAYINTAFAVSGVGGYPSAFFNRTTDGDPSDVEILDACALTADSRIGINRVNYTPGEPLTVEYEVENSYSKKNMNQRVALVMVENHVQGSNGAYNQTNGLSGVSEGAVKATYGDALWPYFRPFAEGPKSISYKDISYNHVARGIWPDYYGTYIDDACQAQVPNKYQMSFDMPEQVMKPENTAIIAMLLDATTGAVINATEVEAQHYNKDLSGVDTLLSETHAAFTLNGKTLNVSAENATVEVYTIDGRCMLRSQVSAQSSQIDLSTLSGMIIVRLTDSQGRCHAEKYIL